MDRKTKKKLDQLTKRLQTLRQQLAGARRQTDEPGEVERLAKEVEATEAEIRRLREGS